MEPEKSKNQNLTNNTVNDLSKFLDELNITFKPKPKRNYAKLEELTISHKYTIKEILKAKTLFGEKMEITLVYTNLGSTIECTVNLPDHYQKITDEQIQVLVKNPNVRFMYKNSHHEILFTQ